MLSFPMYEGTLIYVLYITVLPRIWWDSDMLRTTISIKPLGVCSIYFFDWPQEGYMLEFFHCLLGHII